MFAGDADAYIPIGAIFVVLSQTALSDSKLLYSAKPHGSYNLNVLCIDVYKFGAANRVSNERGKSVYAEKAWVSDLSMVQIWEDRGGKALPAKC